MTKQTYSTYYQDYNKTPSGREVKNKALRKYRRRLVATYGMGWQRAAELHKVERRELHDPK